MSSYWPSLLVSITWVAICLLTLPDDGVFLGQNVPAACMYLVLAFCTVTAVLSIRGLLRCKDKSYKKEYTDEDAAKAKAELERLYLKEHGSLPEYPDEKKENSPGDGDDKKKM